MNSAVKHQADEALKNAYELCFMPLIKYCRVRMGDAAMSADDCVQEAFLVYYNKLLSGEEFQNPRAFLYRTTDNFLKQAIEQYTRTRNRTVPLENAESLSADVLPFDTSDLDYDRLAAVLIGSLTQEEQTLYRWKYIERRQLSEIAELLGISPAATAKRTSRLRSQIKDKLTDTIQSHRKGGI